MDAWWASNTSMRVTSPVKGENLLVSADPKELIVNLSGMFATTPADITGGVLEIKVTNTEFTTDKSGSASDKAAPVIVSADYYPGSMVNETTSALDTLKVVFSEPVTNAFNAETFVFTSGGTVYTVILDKLLQQAQNSTQNVYLVKSTSKFPTNGDLVNISTGKIADKNSNFQDNADNKKVVLKVHDVPYEVVTKIGPNPFIADGNSSVKLTAEPLTKMKETVSIQSSVKIYDGMGNLIWEGEKSVEQGALTIEWDGTNKSGRYVGTGTYVVIMKTINKNSENPQVDEKHYKIGVKR